MLIFVKVIGYNSNIISDIYLQIGLYTIYFLKLFCILNFLLRIYFILRLYFIFIVVNNKNYLNPENYHKFIKKELIELKDLAINISSSDEEKVKIYKHYLRLILLYSLISLFNYTMMVLIQF